MPEVYDSVGMDESFVYMMKKWSFYDTERFNQENLETLIAARDELIPRRTPGECLGVFLNECLFGFTQDRPFAGFALLLAVWLACGKRRAGTWVSLVCMAGLFGVIYLVMIWSDRYLANRVKEDLGVHAIVMPNGVSKSLFGSHKTTAAFTGKPKVMYAGALGHTTDKILGDFEGPWVPWIKNSIEDGSIDFLTFGTPDFLKGLEGKYTSIPYTSVMQFPGVAASYRPDFYLAPLASNNFNRAKSDLKLKEAAALGAVFIGSDFENSPYGYAPKEQLVTESDTPESLADKFNALCKPENFMSAIEWQYNMIEKEHWYIEDPVFQRNFAFTYFG